MILEKLYPKIKDKKVIVRTLSVYYIGFMVDYEYSRDIVTFKNVENKIIYIDCESITSIEMLEGGGR